MADLFWPGDERAGSHFTAEDFVGAMLAVEESGSAATSASSSTAEQLALDAEAGGNPVIPLVRAAPRARRADAASRAHQPGRRRLRADADGGVRGRDPAPRPRLGRRRLAGLAEVHRDTPMVARTLTQHAVPTTFGFRVAAWLSGILDAYDDVARLRVPAAARRRRRHPRGDRRARSRGARTTSPRWHTTRAPVTRIGDALAGCTDACARIANDVLTMSRPEIGELAEGAGGGSSTMPNKANPVLSVLVRRAALTDAAARRDPAPGRRAADRRPRRRRLARRVGDAARPGPPDPRRRLADGRPGDRAARRHRPDGGDARGRRGRRTRRAAEHHRRPGADVPRRCGAVRRPGARAAPRRRSGEPSRCWCSGRRSAPPRPPCGVRAPSCSQPTSSCSPGTCPATARAPAAAPVTIADLARARCSLAGSTARSSTPATRSAARSGSSSRWTRRTGCVGAGRALHRREDRHAGDVGGAGRPGPHVRHPGAGDGVGAALVRPGLRGAGAGSRVGTAARTERRRRRRLRRGLRRARGVRRDAPGSARSRVPVLAVAGAEDVATPPDKLREIADGVPRGRYVELAGVAHLAPAEAPDAVAT